MSQRIIKFRSWDTEIKKMREVLSINFGDPEQGQVNTIETWGKLYTTNEGDVEQSIDVIGCHRLVIMQFTGLHDKNGKDIWEGDILRTATDKPMVVSWNEKFASFCLNRDRWAFTHWFGEACDPSDCEVLGNIYQNGDLLS